MSDLIFKQYSAEVREIDQEKRQLTMAISTETKDRRGDIVETAGWDLKAYKQNPVVLFAHRYDLPAVGKSLRIWKDGPTLMSRTEFAPTPLGQELWTLYSQGYMSAASVGFMPIERERIERGDDDGESLMPSYRYKKQELLEYSLVPVPADRNALALARSAGVDMAEVQRAWNIEADGELIDIAERPYPNEHACRLKDPGQYDTCRRTSRQHEGKTYSVIMCKKGDGPMEEQAYRYPKASWTAAQARSHCSSHDGTFEAASESMISQAELADELDYIRESIKEVGLAEDLKPLAQGLLETLQRETGDDTAVEGIKLNRRSYDLVMEAKALLEEVLANAEPEGEAEESLDLGALADELASRMQIKR